MVDGNKIKKPVKNTTEQVMQTEGKKLMHLAFSSLCVVIVVLLVVVLSMRIVAMFRLSNASASEKTVQVGKRVLPVFHFEPAKDSLTPAQIAIDYQLQLNLFILRNGFLTGTPAVSECVTNACKAAYTLAQLKAGFTRNTDMGSEISQIRPLAPLREMTYHIKGFEQKTL